MTGSMSASQASPKYGGKTDERSGYAHRRGVEEHGEETEDRHSERARDLTNTVRKLDP